MYESRNEKILRATIDGTEYNEEPQSRIEALLLELKETIEAGGGVAVQSDWAQDDPTKPDYIKNKLSVAQAIASGDNGYVTGDQVYQAIGDVETLLASI